MIHIMQDLSIAQQSAPSAQNSNSSQYQFSRMNAPRWLSPFRAFTSRPPSGSEADGEGLPQMSVRQPL
ncbi:hypothetical protein NXW48_04860 [Phocaeicola vulgatus]|nr:hypothetical protein [Phocaeicola vulgatus]